MTDRELMQQALEKLEFFAHMKGVSEDTARLIAALRERLAQPEQEPGPVAWRDHVEQRLLTWRQSFVNKSGDQLALDDFMDKRSLDDLIDFVCDEYTDPQPVKFNCTVVDDAHPEGVPLSQWGQQQKQKPFCYYDGRNIVGKEYAHHCDVFPLYIDPQPEQEPLTDEEIEREWQFLHDEEGNPPDHHDFARAIEAAHGIGEKPDAA